MTNSGYLITPFRADHVLGVELVEANVSMEGLRAAQWHPSWSLFYNDQFIAGAGFIRCTPWLAQAWLVCSNRTKQHLKAVVKAIRIAVESLPVARIQAACSVNTPNAGRLLEAVGFVYEATMPLYGKDGESYLQYVVLKGER